MQLNSNRHCLFQYYIYTSRELGTYENLQIEWTILRGLNGLQIMQMLDIAYL